MKNYEKLVNKFPNNGEYRKLFYTSKSKHRRACKHEANLYKHKIMKNINCNTDNDPKIFGTC